MVVTSVALVIVNVAVLSVGGLCTTWSIDGATIDGCIHFLTGSSTGRMAPIYQELGIYKKMKV